MGPDQGPLPEEATQLTPEQEAQRVETRKGLVKPILDRFVPDAPNADKPNEFFLERYAQVSGISVDQLDDEGKNRANSAYLLRNFAKDVVVEKFAKTHEPGDLDAYITTAYSVGKETALPRDEFNNKDSDEFNGEVIDNFIRVANDLETGKLYQEFALEWKNKFIPRGDFATALWRYRDFTRLMANLAEGEIGGQTVLKSIEATRGLFDSYVEVFDYAYGLGGHLDQQSTRELIARCNLITDKQDPQQIKRLLHIAKSVENFDERFKYMFISIAGRYATKHELTDEAVQGFLTKLFPAIQSGDPQVEVLLGKNIWSMNVGEFGVAEFITHSFGSKVTPANINELLIATSEIPSTNAAKFEQNRSDAYDVSSALRELVHDQRPYVHNFVSAMVSYYDTGDRRILDSTLQQAREYERGSFEYQFSQLSEVIFTKDFYDREIEIRRLGGKKEKAIDTLRRIAENSKPIEDTPPVTSDTQLNERLNSFNTQTLGATLDYVNNQLEEMMQKEEVGIEPNSVLAIAWIGRKVFEVLQSMRYEDQLAAYKSDLFTSILRFQDLTASPNYFNEQEFQNFVERLKGSPNAQGAYKMVANRVMFNTDVLARKYKEKGVLDIGVLWSGNTTHELIGLTDPRPAITEQGRKAVKLIEEQRTEPGYHPGD